MSFREALLGWSLVTAKIFYFMPDRPEIVNPNWLLWQADDRAPDFPRLNVYLRWWDAHIDAKINSIQVAMRGLIHPTDLKYLGGEFRLN